MSPARARTGSRIRVIARRSAVALVLGAALGVGLAGIGGPAVAQDRRAAGITEDRLYELDRTRALEALEAREAARRSERERLARMLATPWEPRAESVMSSDPERAVVELVHEGRSLAAVWLFERIDEAPASDPSVERLLRFMVPPGESEKVAIPRGRWRVQVLLGAHGLGRESTAPLEVRIARREGALSRLGERDATKIRTKLEERRREAFRRSADSPGSP